eukprot:COSAG04_NODE_12160_length_667_cov_1.001761_1_plen_163_part_01
MCVCVSITVWELEECWVRPPNALLCALSDDVERLGSVDRCVSFAGGPTPATMAARRSYARSDAELGLEPLDDEDMRPAPGGVLTSLHLAAELMWTGLMLAGGWDFFALLLISWGLHPALGNGTCPPPGDCGRSAMLFLNINLLGSFLATVGAIGLLAGHCTGR